MQEKDDMIEQLQAELETKRQEIEEAQRTVADMKEELDIMEKKHTHVEGERDMLAT